MSLSPSPAFGPWGMPLGADADAGAGAGTGACVVLDIGGGVRVGGGGAFVVGSVRVSEVVLLERPEPGH